MCWGTQSEGMDTGVLVDTKLNMATSLHLYWHQQPLQAHTSTGSCFIHLPLSAQRKVLEQGRVPQRSRRCCAAGRSTCRGEVPSSVLLRAAFPLVSSSGSGEGDSGCFSDILRKSGGEVSVWQTFRNLWNFIPKSLPPLSKPCCGWRWAPAYKFEPRLGLG